MTTFSNTWGIPFKLYNPAIGDVASRLVQGQPCVQIIHGLEIADSLYTVILPPYWTPSPNRYPIVVNSQYDINANLFTPGLGSLLPHWIAESGLGGNTGAIGVIWNGGGSVSTATVNNIARHQFASVVDALAGYPGWAGVGGDRNRIIMFGGSRGGTATLMIASNPEHRNYRVTYALAASPGTKVGTGSYLISATLPAQLAIGLNQSGFNNAWLPGWTYPASGKPSMVGMTADQAFRQLVAGSWDIGTVDWTSSPNSDQFVSGLRDAQTQVVLSMGSHDEYIPYGQAVEYLFKLRAWGVPVEAEIIMRGGHETRPGFYDRARLAMLSYVMPGAPVAWRTAETGNGSIDYWRINRSNNQAEYFANASQIQFPFTLEVPRVMYGGMRIVMMVTGEPGTYYEVHTNVAPPIVGTIPNGAGNTTSHFAWAEAMTGPGGVITYNVLIQKPGQAAMWLDNTQCRHKHSRLSRRTYQAAQSKISAEHRSGTGSRPHVLRAGTRTFPAGPLLAHGQE